MPFFPSSSFFSFHHHQPYNFHIKMHEKSLSFFKSLYAFAFTRLWMKDERRIMLISVVFYVLSILTEARMSIRKTIKWFQTEITLFVSRILCWCRKWFRIKERSRKKPHKRHFLLVLSFWYICLIKMTFLKKMKKKLMLIKDGGGIFSGKSLRK